MKDLMNTLKWIKSQCGKYFIYVFIIILIGSISSLASVYRALISKNLVDGAISGNISLIIKPLILLGSVIIYEISSSAFSSYLKVKCSAKLSAHIQKKFYTHIINSKWQEQAKYHSGNLLSRITSDVGNITEVIVKTLPSIVSLLILLITAFITLYHFDAKLALLSITIIPICIFTGKLYTRKLKDIHKKSQELDATYYSFMQESIQNLLILKTFCLEETNLDRMTELQNSKIKLSLKKSSIGIFANLFMSLGGWCGFFLVFCWGAFNLSKGTGTYGTLTALLQLMSAIQVPFYGLAGSLPQLSASIGSAERLIAIETLSLEDKSYKELNNELSNNLNPVIEFKNVSFEYMENAPILKDMSFSIQPGETIGILGPSGEGKTTIIRLLLSLIDSKQGYICFKNNNEEMPVNPNTRNLISYVPQGNTLFSGSIKSNLLYGNKDASEPEIEAALSAAGALNFVNSLNDKLNTIIGEKGVGLSEGQAQRIAIARALLRKKPILILDEATSSLDVETELKILHTIQNLKHNPTCIIITHRPSALSICDRTFKLENNQLHEVTSYPNDESAAGIINESTP